MCKYHRIIPAHIVWETETNPFALNSHSEEHNFCYFAVNVGVEGTDWQNSKNTPKEILAP